MLQAHSFLWHYLWLAPNVLQLVLAGILWRRQYFRSFPFFLTFIVFEALEQLTLYGMDVLPSISAEAFWRVYCGGTLIEGLLKFAVVGELLFCLLRPWRTLASAGSRLLNVTGAVLVLVAVLTATYARIDNSRFSIISHAHILQQSLYIIQCGLVLFLFLFAFYFRLTWSSQAFGIALGFAIVWCEHLATWAVAASGAFIERRELLDFLNMATYHFCVLIWFYYFLVPQKKPANSAVLLPEHNLDIWNRELERLLQQ